MALIFDSHAHYLSPQFDEDRDVLLNSFKENGVGLVMSVSCCVETTKKNAELIKNYPFVFASAGVHPLDCEGEKEGYLAELEDIILQNKKMVAIGEIGLDYHYGNDKAIQRKFFVEQLELAKKLDMPVIIHSREATIDTLEILKEYKPKGVVHCFSGSAETAQELLKMGLYIGFTGVVTFHNANKSVRSAASIPMDRLLIETDCPYMAPVPFRGQRCDSIMLHSVAQKLAEIKNVTKDEIIEATYNNAIRLFEMEELI